MKRNIQIEGQLDFFDLLFQEEKSEKENDNENDKENNDKEIVKTKEKATFVECENCWCNTCKHNSRKEAVPRDIMGEMKPCPSCDRCYRLNKATICVIGSAKEGCRLRAKEEGLINEQ